MRTVAVRSMSSGARGGKERSAAGGRRRQCDRAAPAADVEIGGRTEEGVRAAGGCRAPAVDDRAPERVAGDGRRRHGAERRGVRGVGHRPDGVHRRAAVRPRLELVGLAVQSVCVAAGDARRPTANGGVGERRRADRRADRKGQSGRHGDELQLHGRRRDLHGRRRLEPAGIGGRQPELEERRVLVVGGDDGPSGDAGVVLDRVGVARRRRRRSGGGSATSAGPRGRASRSRRRSPRPRTR